MREESKTIEAMKMALDALEDYEPNNAHKAITFLRAAIAEAEREEEARIEQIMLDVWQDVGNPRLPGIKPKQNQCGEVCERAKLCAICARGLEEIEQEPVAWRHTTAMGHHYFRLKPQDPMFKPVPLYTHPPRREWVGLTDGQVLCIIEEEAKALRTKLPFALEMCVARAVEAKLKEKNL